jgi:hypothetical protein
VRHAFKAAFTYNLPAPFQNRIARTVLNSWMVAAIYSVRTASPVNILVTRNDIQNARLLNARPDLIAGVPLYINNPSLPGGRGINPAAFSIPVEPRQGDLGRNALRGSPLMDMDLAVQRQFRLTERVRLEWRTDFFNLFNSTAFLVDGGLGSFPPFSPNPLFGTGIRTLMPPRQIQLALRLRF